MTVNWKFFDGFDPQGQFYTDSNSLGMLVRNLNKRDWNQNGTYQTFAQNYYPVTSAIAMRDQNGSNVQVTIMNDRA